MLLSSKEGYWVVGCALTGIGKKVDDDDDAD
jgi:hypothetical protein